MHTEIKSGFLISPQVPHCTPAPHCPSKQQAASEIAVSGGNMVMKTRPKCQFCGKAWSKPLAIQKEDLRQELTAIARDGGKQCQECVAETTQFWPRIALHSQAYLQ